MDVRNKQRTVTPCLGVILRFIIGRSVQHDKRGLKVVLYQAYDIDLTGTIT